MPSRVTARPTYAKVHSASAERSPMVYFFELSEDPRSFDPRANLRTNFTVESVPPACLCGLTPLPADCTSSLSAPGRPVHGWRLLDSTKRAGRWRGRKPG